MLTRMKRIKTNKYGFTDRIENSVDPDQLASQKPADQEPRCFSLVLKMHVVRAGFFQVNWIGEEWSAQKCTVKLKG